jgi:hypothetical protein
MRRTAGITFGTNDRIDGAGPDVDALGSGPSAPSGELNISESLALLLDILQRSLVLNSMSG